MVSTAVHPANSSLCSPYSSITDLGCPLPIIRSFIPDVFTLRTVRTGITPTVDITPPTPRDSIDSNMSYGSTSSLTPQRAPSTPIRRNPSPSPARTEGHASVKSSVVNLTNTVIGAGALAFPSAFASMGLIPGIVSCVFSASMTAFGLFLLSRCATVVGTRPGDEGRKASFNEVARLSFSKGWAVRLFDVSQGVPYIQRYAEY